MYTMQRSRCYQVPILRDTSTLSVIVNLLTIALWIVFGELTVNCCYALSVNVPLALSHVVRQYYSVKGVLRFQWERLNFDPFHRQNL